MSQHPLTADEETTYDALKKLVARYTPHASGGFDPDDITTLCALPAEDIHTHLDNLESRGLVKSMEAPMPDDAWPTHYTLPV